MSKNDGGPAFPFVVSTSDTEASDSGMSIRDYFAIHAPMRNEVFSSDAEEARRRYELADAMLAERDK